MMKKNLTAGFIGLLSFSSFPAIAAQQSHPKPLCSFHQEMIGFGTGATAGAIIANVPGALIGGFMGALLTKTHQLHVDNEKYALEKNKKNTCSPLATKKCKILHKSVNVEGKKLTQGMTLDFHFRTASIELNDRDEIRLKKVGLFLKQFPALTIRIDGYADLRGKSDFNMELSQMRVESIANALEASGINKNRLLTHAHGKNASFEHDTEGYAFDRRVSISLNPSNLATPK